MSNLLLLISMARAAPQQPLPDVPAVTAPSTGVGELYVTSDPPGAAIWLDGTDTGVRAPSVLPGVVVGPHEVEGRTPCARASATVEVKALLIARAELAPIVGTGTIAIVTEPSGAMVVLDGADTGTAPITLAELSCGMHTVTVRAPGFLEVTRETDVVAYESADLTVALVKETFGTIVISPVPLEARVVVDGQEAGAGPMTIAGLPTGSHALTISADGYLSDERMVDVPADDVVRVDVVLVEEHGGSHGRRVLVASTIGTGALGLVSAGGAVWSYSAGRSAFQDYLDIPDDAAADAWYADEVVPRRTQTWVFGGVAAALLGTSATLAVVGDFQLLAGPNNLSLHGSW